MDPTLTLIRTLTLTLTPTPTLSLTLSLTLTRSGALRGAISVPAIGTPTPSSPAGAACSSW